VWPLAQQERWQSQADLLFKSANGTKVIKKEDKSFKKSKWSRK
jgi:hypothetical protein